MSINRTADLRADYEMLGEKLRDADGSSAASIARERRLIGELLEALEQPEEVSVVDQLAARRRADANNLGAASRRRKPG